MNQRNDTAAIAHAIDPNASRDRTVAALSVIWVRVLQLPEINPDEDFFDLGGDSMIAVALFGEIDHVFGRNLPITAIYDAPTVNRLADLLMGEKAVPFSHLVSLKAGIGKHPLFIVHGVGGSVMELGRVATQMDFKGPVYGIQALGFAGEEPIDDMRTMVDRYLDAVRSVSPHGPYLLAGYSYGGLVAMEMARLIRAAGETVDRLVMIDSYPIASIWPRFLRFDCLCRQIWRRIRLLASGGIGGVWSYLTTRKHAAATIEQKHLFPVDPDVLPSVERVQFAAERALMAYRPAYYPGDVIFIAADQPSPAFPRHPRIMWEKLTASLDIHGVEATHLTMVAEHAGRLAEILSTLFDSRSRSVRSAVKPSAHVQI